ncbi:hypothetical protein DLJ47_20725 [Micromonospora sp. S4605]|uniref:hypothetical protein n=1 Tax=Micromonospora sp. S4605 TaxID=1420897 RepID=UPI000D6FFA65|nr:hypothetical protein [Micromonospora sp. S4605]PWU51734.1 hypothetical protein DLJ47_20725 [Micromonospora sp. S4605]
MGATDPGTAREEAERLVAALLAAGRLAASGSAAGGLGPLGGIVSSVLGHSGGSGASGGRSGGGFATGTAECCVCPICRAMSALRDPSPEFAERLATGAGDLAAGVASLLRAFAPAEPPPATAPPAGATATGADQPAADARPGADDDRVWREAPRSGHDSEPAPEPDVWSAATRAEDVTAPAAAVPPVDVAGAAAPGTARAAADRRVVPASRVPDHAAADAPGDGA